MDYQSFLELLKSRRSIRRFKPNPVPDEYVEKILEAARWAPSGANSQPWEFLVVKDKETRMKIVELSKETQDFSRRMELTREEDLRHPAAYWTGGDPGFKDAPVYIILLGDPRLKETYILTAYYGHADKNFYSDLADTFLYMHLAAKSLGLGSQWITATAQPFLRAMLQDLLGIPKDLIIYDTMALGYPAHEPKPRTVRKLNEIVHYDRYDQSKYRSYEEVKRFIATIHKERR